MPKLNSKFTAYRYQLLLLCLLLIAGCAVKARYPADAYRTPQTLALLPLSNQSNDLDAPDIARGLMFNELTAKGYGVIDIAQTDAILKENGISEGGQLGAIEPKKLGELLNAQFLMYGDIIEYNYVNVGVYRNRVVELEFKLVDPLTAEVRWQNTKKVSNQEFAADNSSIKESFIRGLAEKMIEKIVSKPLYAECKEAVKKISLTLPNAPTGALK